MKKDRGHEIVKDLSDLGVSLDVLLVAFNQLILSSYCKAEKLTFLIVR